MSSKMGPFSVDYRPPADIQTRIFVGFGHASAQEAADAAAAKLNEWEPFRKWRTADGHSIYQVNASVEIKGGIWVCTLTATGQDIEKRDREWDASHAYTGATERLD